MAPKKAAPASLEEETERMFAHSQIFRCCDVRYRGGETVELVPKSGYHVTMTYRATPVGRVA
jgi:hypothetical protein